METNKKFTVYDLYFNDEIDNIFLLYLSEIYYFEDCTRLYNFKEMKRLIEDKTNFILDLFKVVKLMVPKSPIFTAEEIDYIYNNFDKKIRRIYDITPIFLCFECDFEDEADCCKRILIENISIIFEFLIERTDFIKYNLL